MSPTSTLADSFAGPERDLDLCSIGAKRALVGVTKWCAGVASVANCRSLAIAAQWNLWMKFYGKPTLVIGSVPYKQETVAHSSNSRSTFWQ